MNKVKVNELKKDVLNLIINLMSDMRKQGDIIIIDKKYSERFHEIFQKFEYKNN